MDGFIVKPIRRCPEEKANFISKVCFWWMKELFVIGASKDLQMEDMFLPMKSDESKVLTDKLERAWNKELSKLKNLDYASGSNMKKPIPSSEPSLARAIFTVFWWDYLKAGIEMLVMCAGLRTLQPVLQKGIIAHFDASGSMTKTSREVGVYYAAGLVVTTLVVVIFHNHYNVSSQKVAMRVRVSCSSLMYRKILRLSKSSLNLTTPGQIVNLLSNDVSRFDVVAVLLNQLWITPIQIIVIGSIMYSLIGPAALAGLSLLLLVIIPFQLIMNQYSKRLRRKIAVFTDKRLQLMGDLINGIQVIKMYAWEKPFANIVINARIAEMRAIRKTTYLRSLILSLTIFSDKLNLFLTLLAYVLSGNVLTAEITFTIVMYFNIVRAGSTYFFNGLMQAGETTVSIRRLQEFLLLDEITGDAVIQSSDEKKCYDNPTFKNDTVLSSSTKSSPKIKKINEDKCEETLEQEIKKNVSKNAVSINLQRVTATWKIGEMPSTLCDLSMKIRGGELCALVGQVGSGKSSLLNIILRELPIGAGNLYLCRRDTENSEEMLKKHGYVTDVPDLTISYASQDPWLFVGTVRDNILFGQPWDPERYREVTRVCALRRDIRQWPNGDLTIVGERGIALSGGQKARVNLARAVYKRADIYLFDDPLSAVDTRVGRHLFKKCIKNYLKGKTRILVTHQLQYLKSIDTIVILDRGFVRAQGTYDNLSKTSNEFITLMNELKKTKKLEEKCSEDVNDEQKKKESYNVRRSDSNPSVDSLATSLDCSYDDVFSDRSGSQISEIIDKGTMSRRIWKRYFQAGGGFFTIIFTFLIFLMAQVAFTGTDFWISYWSNLETLRGNIHEYENFDHRKQYISYVNNTVFEYFSIVDNRGLLTRFWAINIYTIFIISCVVLSLGQCFTFMALCMRSSKNLHKSMFHSILHTTMRFFNANPSGRILNRFSKDVGTMDELLPRAMLDATQSALFVIGVFVSIIIIDPWMFFPMMILFAVLYFLMIYYLRVANGIKRLEGIAKSPVFSQVNTTLQGLPTIRSNGPVVSEMLHNQFDSYQDVHSGTWYLSVVASSSFGLYVDISVSLFVACVCFSLILFENGRTLGETSGGSAGLAICQAIKLINLLQFGVKQSAETYSFMSSIERILQYVDIKSEGSGSSGNAPPADWPPKGRLSLKNVYLSYDAENSPVLKGLNLTIEAGWKVGVVGRTGAGKSSLISAIFRLENEGLDGEIKIDSIDTSTLDLQELRSRISIIPQQSVLFSGTLRFNIDPFDVYTDDALWDALREVELSDLCLDQVVSEGGTNFSVGQRQLICLARAILSNNKILILDEATANIDSHTDALIQMTLKTKFHHRTVITVAHRLITVIESDRIIVMDGGQVAEFGCPYELLSEHPNGPFAEMVRQAGSSMANKLIKLAEVTCQQVSPQYSLDLESSRN